MRRFTVCASVIGLLCGVSGHATEQGDMREEASAVYSSLGADDIWYGEFFEAHLEEAQRSNSIIASIKTETGGTLALISKKKTEKKFADVSDVALDWGAVADGKTFTRVLVLQGEGKIISTSDFCESMATIANEIKKAQAIHKGPLALQLRNFYLEKSNHTRIRDRAFEEVFDLIDVPFTLGLMFINESSGHTADLCDMTLNAAAARGKYLRKIFIADNCLGLSHLSSLDLLIKASPELRSVMLDATMIPAPSTASQINHLSDTLLSTHQSLESFYEPVLRIGTLTSRSVDGLAQKIHDHIKGRYMAFPSYFGDPHGAKLPLHIDVAWYNNCLTGTEAENFSSYLQLLNYGLCIVHRETLEERIDRTRRSLPQIRGKLWGDLECK